MNEKRTLRTGEGGNFGKDLPLKPNYTGKVPNQSVSSSANACLSMHSLDRMRLQRFPADDVIKIEDIIRRAWPRGIKDRRVRDAANEVTLRVSPWRTSWIDERTDAYRLICRILSGLFDMGWVPKAFVNYNSTWFTKAILYYITLIPFIAIGELTQARCLPIPASTATAGTVHLVRPFLRQG